MSRRHWFGLSLLATVAVAAGAEALVVGEVWYLFIPAPLVLGLVASRAAPTHVSARRPWSLPRLGAVPVAAVLCALGGEIVILGLMFLAIAAQSPDPRAPDGDPCCAVPDSWGQVALGVAGGVATLAVALLVLAAAWRLAAFSLSGRAPRRRRRAAATLGAE